MEQEIERTKILRQVIIDLKRSVITDSMITFPPYYCAVILEELQKIEGTK